MIDDPAREANGHADGRPPLRRSVGDRKLAGVCGGFGRYLDVDPIVFRVLLAVLTVFGGIGLVLYGTAWLLVPNEGTERSEGRRLLDGKADADAWAAGTCLVVGVLMVVLVAGDGGSAVLLPALALAGFFVVMASRDNTVPRSSGEQSGGGTPADHRPAADDRPTADDRAVSQAAGSAYQSAAASVVYGPYLAGDDTGAGGSYGAAEPTTPYEFLDPPTAPPSTERRSPVLFWLVTSAALVVAGGILVLERSQVLLGHAQTVLAAVLVVVGLGLVVGTWFGRSRGLIALGAAVTAALMLVSVVTRSVPFNGGFGSPLWAPATVGEIQSPYRLGGGQAHLDLTRLDLGTAPVSVEASVTFGQLTVRVPREADVEIRAHSGMGSMKFPDGQEVSGVDVDHTYRASPTTHPADGTLELEVRVGVGEVVVLRVAP